MINLDNYTQTTIKMFHQEEDHHNFLIRMKTVKPCPNFLFPHSLKSLHRSINQRGFQIPSLLPDHFIIVLIALPRLSLSLSPTLFHSLSTPAAAAAIDKNCPEHY